MTAWTPGELAALTTAYSLVLRAGDAGDAEDARDAGDSAFPTVEVGMVLVQGELYVRAFRGTGSVWYRAAREHGHGRIRVGAVTCGVVLRCLDGTGPADAIDAAYRAKYGSGTGDLATGPVARSATLRVMPARPQRQQQDPNAAP